MSGPHPAADPNPASLESVTLLLAVWLALSILASVAVGFAWFMAPFAPFIGPSQGVRSDAEFARALGIFRMSWYWGLPLLALGQITAFVLAFRRLRVAATLSTAALVIFVALIALVISTF